MDVKVVYSQLQLEYAVGFLSVNNSSFLGQENEIRQTILNEINHLVGDPNIPFVSVMGFTLISDWTFAGIDFDENICHIEILVDPSINDDDAGDEEDLIETNVTINDPIPQGD